MFDVVVWTGGSSLLPWVPEVQVYQAACRRCLSSSLSYTAGPISSSFSAESLALVRGLKWCHSHLKTCHFQSALFLTDSQSALTLLSPPRRFSNQSPFGIFGPSLFGRSASIVSPIMLDFLVMNWQTRSPKLEQHSSLPMFQAHWPRSLQRWGMLIILIGVEILQLSRLPSSFGMLRGTGPSPSHLLCTVPTSLPQSQPSLVLLPMQNNTEEEFFWEHLRISSAGCYLLLNCSASEARHLWHYFFHFWPLVQNVGRCLTLGLRGVPLHPHPLEGLG